MQKDLIQTIIVKLSKIKDKEFGKNINNQNKTDKTQHEKTLDLVK